MSKTTNVIIVFATWGFDVLSIKKESEGGVSEDKGGFNAYLNR